MLAGGTSAFGLGLDLLVLAAATMLLVAAAARLYPSIVR
jgi:hypothetical protein